MGYYQKWRGHAEIVLEDYHYNRTWLKRTQNTAIYGNDKEPGTVRGSDVSDPTQRAAMQLLNARVQQVRREVRAVEKVHKDIQHNEQLTELMDLVWMNRRCRLHEAAELLGVSYRTAIRYKKIICTMLARELGWI